MDDKKNLGSWVMYRDDFGAGHTLFEGDTDECEKYCKLIRWKYEGKDVELWTIYY